MKKIILILAVIISYSAIAQEVKKPIALEDIWAKRTFNQEYVAGFNFLKDGSFYTALEYDMSGSYIVKHNTLDGSVVDTIFKSEQLGAKIGIDNYAFSSNEQKILVSTQTESIYRRSSKSYYYIVDLSKKNVIPLSNNDLAKQMNASFSPDGSKVAFVRDNNIFIKDLNALTEVQITKDGLQNKIINGYTDWVYEEEFEFVQGIYWSPNSTTVAYYKFDESAVKEFHMPVYNGLYPEDYTYKYPKAGEANSIVSIHFYALSSQKTVDAKLGEEKDIYIPRILWTSNDAKLCILKMNRHQNELQLLAANPSTGETQPILNLSSKTYIEIHDDISFLKDNKGFIMSHEDDGFRNVYHYDMNGKLINKLTKGQFDVTDVYGIDELKGLVYYQAAGVNPMQREVYVTDLKGKKATKLSKEAGTNSAVFTNDFKYFINYHTATQSPLKISLMNNKGQSERVLQDNANLKNKLKTFDIGTKEFIKVPAADTVTSLNGWMIKPSNFDASKKYPVLMFVYGGPGSQTVTDAWGGANELWYYHLAQQGYIIVSVDNRGTGARGRDFKNCTYLQLGKYEAEDQIAAAEWLKKQSYIDGERIGIQGWSFGGYMSSLAISKGNYAFKMAIAVAPVTNWRFYDSIYTERFLRTPQENESGYEDNSPINFVNKINGKYLIIHGTADDNVHFQNAAEMVDKMIASNIDFESAYYPDKNHGIYGGFTRLHLYRKMTNYIKENL
jgi:dipeptidyl-peptidase 4